MQAAFEHQLALANFPADVQVFRQLEGENQIFGIVQAAGGQGERGLEIILTPGAVKMYGEGPSVNLVLSHFKHVLQQGLPPREPDGGLVRSVFLGD